MRTSERYNVYLTHADSPKVCFQGTNINVHSKIVVCSLTGACDLHVNMRSTITVCFLSYLFDGFVVICNEDLINKKLHSMSIPVT